MKSNKPLHFPGLNGLRFIAAFALIYLLVIPITIMVAAFSYKYFEIPFLKMKKKFEVVSSSS